MRGLRLIALSMLVAGPVGCQEPEAEEADTDEAEQEELPSPYADSGGETEGEQPAMAMDQAIASSMAGLQAFVALQPDAVLDAYTALAVLEPECPEEQETFDEGTATTTVWYSEGGCTTSTGITFRGGGRLTTESIVEPEVSFEATTLSSEGTTMRIAADDGRFFEMTGYLGVRREAGPEATEAGFELVGRYAADEATAAGSALLEGKLRAQGYIFSFSDGSTNALGGSGSLAGEALGEARAFSFSNLLVLLSGCGSEPIGAMSVRDDVGFWHDIVFDTGVWDPESAEEPVYDDALCDGCGAYLAGGESLGSACITPADLESLLDWEGSPW